LIAMANTNHPQSRSASAMYTSLAASGFAYGPSFRLVKKIWAGIDVMYGVVGSLPLLGQEAGIYSNTACMLDACTQLATEWTEKYHPGRPAFPASIGTVTRLSDSSSIWSDLKKLIPGASAVIDSDWLVLMRLSPLAAPIEFVNQISVDMIAVSQDQGAVFFENFQLTVVDNTGEIDQDLIVLEKHDNDWTQVPEDRLQGHGGHMTTMIDMRNVDFEIQISGPMETLIQPLITDDACEKDMIEIETKFWGLSFLDVLVAKGVMPPSMFGGEYSGIVSAVGTDAPFRVGDRVVAVHNGGGIRSRLVVPASAVSKFDCMQYTLDEAASLPVSFCTALFAIQRGGVKRGDTVLVHNVTGGLGMAIIEILQKKFHDIHIIGTCSRKQAAVGISEILNSRDTSGWLSSGSRRVNVSIGAMHAELIEATLPLMKSFGVIVDVGKRLQTENYGLGLSSFVRGFTYTTAHLDELMVVDQVAVTELLDDILKMNLSIPTRIFDDIDQALEFLSSGQHVGKVVLRLPDREGKVLGRRVVSSPRSVSGKFHVDELPSLIQYPIRTELQRLYGGDTNVWISRVDSLNQVVDQAMDGVKILVSKDISDHGLLKTLRSIIPQSTIPGMVLITTESELAGPRAVPRVFRKIRQTIIENRMVNTHADGGESAWLLNAIAKQLGKESLTLGEMDKSIEHLGIDSLGRLQLWHSFKKHFPNSRLTQLSANMSVKILIGADVPEQTVAGGGQRWLAIHGFRTNPLIMEHQVGEFLRKLVGNNVFVIYA